MTNKKEDTNGFYKVADRKFCYDDRGSGYPLETTVLTA